VAHSGGGDQLENGVHHAESCAEHGHNNNVRTNDTTVCRTERCRDGGDNRVHRAQGFGGEQQADSGGGATEFRWSSADVAKLRQRVMRQWMVDQVKGHG